MGGEKGIGIRIPDALDFFSNYGRIFGMIGLSGGAHRGFSQIMLIKPSPVDCGFLRTGYFQRQVAPRTLATVLLEKNPALLAECRDFLYSMESTN
jgi:hypothetical protein